jgi:predicted transporter
VSPLNLTWLSVSGVLIGILIFALKVSLGCGLASLSRREMLSIAAGYLVISLFMGMAIDHIPDYALASALNTGVAMHLAVALLLVTLGITTARRWNSHHHDISRKTFWVLSMPCPACLAASFISCSFLAGLLDIDPWKIGAVVGFLFFLGISAFSTVLGRINGTPSFLGNAMIFLGIFYILSILLIPAYLNSQKISFVSMNLPIADIASSYLMILSLVALGFLGRKWGVPF